MVSGGGVNIKNHVPLYIIPYVYGLILSYSWSLDSNSLHFCFFKDDLKLSTQDFTWSSDNFLPSRDIRTTTASLDFLSFYWSDLYRVSRTSFSRPVKRWVTCSHYSSVPLDLKKLVTSSVLLSCGSPCSRDTLSWSGT